MYLDTIIILEDFDKKCFGYRKVKTRHVYLWRGITRYLWFQRVLKTLIIQLSVFSHAGFPDWLGCYFIIMLGSDWVLQIHDRMVWSSGDELDDEDVLHVLDFYSVVNCRRYIQHLWGQFIITVQYWVIDVLYSKDVMYK